MADAPEQIWVELKEVNLGASDDPFYCINGKLADIPFDGLAEYVRADLTPPAAVVEAMERALRDFDCGFCRKNRVCAG